MVRPGCSCSDTGPALPCLASVLLAPKPGQLQVCAQHQGASAGPQAPAVALPYVHRGGLVTVPRDQILPRGQTHLTQGCG